MTFVFLTVLVGIVGGVVWAVDRFSEDRPRVTTLLIGSILFFAAVIVAKEARYAPRFLAMIVSSVQVSGLVLCIVGVVRLLRKPED